MPKVVSLDAHRAYRCACGSEHFRLLSTPLPPAVTLDAAGHITSYAGTIVCDECGAEQDGPRSEG